MTSAQTITEASIKAGTVTRTGLFQFVTDVSEIGIKPGTIPRSIPTTIGNRLPFILTEGSPQCFKYRQNCGCPELVVYND